MTERSPGNDNGNGNRLREVVVVVDDEEMVLTSINSFLALETDYEVVTFTNPEHALEHLQQHEANLVISDYFMPQMDGITFLGKVRDLRPETTRILLTGYSDKENASRRSTKSVCSSISRSPGTTSTCGWSCATGWKSNSSCERCSRRCRRSIGPTRICRASSRTS